MDTNFYPLFRIFEAMTFIFIILAIAIGYWLIKGWINIVNFFFNPLINKLDKKNQLKKSRIKVKKSKQLFNNLSKNASSSENNTIALEIDSIEKRNNYFTTNIKIRNISNKPIFYNLGECYFASETGLQIKGDTTRIVEMFSENENRILPNLHIVRNISFYDKYANFSENDLFVCEIKINKESHLLTTNLKSSNIQNVALEIEMA